MIKFEISTSKKEQELLKPIAITLNVTNISDKTIDIAKEIYKIEFIENKKETAGCSFVYSQEDLEYISLAPNKSFKIKVKEKHYIEFWNTYKRKNQIEEFTLSLNVSFYIKGIGFDKAQVIQSENELNLEIDYSNIKLLLTQTKEESKYIEYNNEIVYISEYSRAYEKPAKRVNIDKEDLRVLDRVYCCDKEKVYRDGNLQRISAQGFKVFNDLFAGNNEKILTSYGDAKIKHPSSFEVLKVYEGVGSYKRGYVRDKEFLYFFDEGSGSSHAIVCKACKNPSTFEELFAKDENHYIYGKCERTVYINGASISMAKSDSWEYLGSYSKDSKNVFYHTYKVKGANPNTFEVLKDPEEENKSLEKSCWGKDDKKYYRFENESSKEKYQKYMNKQ